MGNKYNFFCLRAFVAGGFVIILGSVLTEARTTREIQLSNSTESTGNKQGIPLRCITNSVSPVTCDRNFQDNLLPHPDDCQLFYYCVSASLPPICRQCPAGLHFNPLKRVCDRPQDAGCLVQSTTLSDSDFISKLLQ